MKIYNKINIKLQICWLSELIDTPGPGLPLITSGRAY